MDTAAWNVTGHRSLKSTDPISIPAWMLGADMDSKYLRVLMVYHLNYEAKAIYPQELAALTGLQEKEVDNAQNWLRREGYLSTSISRDQMVDRAFSVPDDQRLVKKVKKTSR